MKLEPIIEDMVIKAREVGKRSRAWRILINDEEEMFLECAIGTTPDQVRRYVRALLREAYAIHAGTKGKKHVKRQQNSRG